MESTESTKIATSFSIGLLLVGSLITGVTVWLLRVTIEVNAKEYERLPTYIALLHGRFTGWIKQFAGPPARYWPLPTAVLRNAVAQRRGVSCLIMTMN